MAQGATSAWPQHAPAGAFTQEPQTVAAPAASMPVVLVQLVAPGEGGVRDYADCLRRQWSAVGIESQLIVLSESDARAQSLAERLEQVVTSSGRSCALLLHYSGYGFQRRGLCFWIVRELDHARARLGSRLHVVTMFHELVASGPPWRSAFWLAAIQARIASSLVRLSDRLLTNSEHHACRLRDRLGARKPVHVWPVFSTVGEPARVAPARSRRLQIVVFGSESTRARALAMLPRHAEMLRRHGVRVVVEVGPGVTAGLSTHGLEHRVVGRLSEVALRPLLEGSAFGLIDYPSIHLGKSTVFAAYLVHGCIVLNTAPGYPDADGLARGKHFLNLEDAPALPITPAERQGFADAGRAWYARHTLARQAVASAQLCGASPEPQAATA